MSVTREEFDILQREVKLLQEKLEVHKSSADHDVKYARKSELESLRAELNLHKTGGDHDMRYGSRNDVASLLAQLDNILSSASFDGGNGLILRSTNGTKYKVTVTPSGTIAVTAI